MALLPKLNVTLPKGKITSKASTPTFDAAQAGKALASYATTSHLRTLYDTRISTSDVDLVQQLMRLDPDVSAAVNAYLTVANTEMRINVVDLNGQIDRAGYKLINQVILGLTSTIDYSLGFSMSKSFKARNTSLRFMILLRGAIALEMVLDENSKSFIGDARLVDANSLEWIETKPGRIFPQQVQKSGDPVKLDTPTFFYQGFRQDPTSTDTSSPFISVINTVFARQQIINDLYGLMQITGYPRMVATVLEETIRNSLPVTMRADIKKSDEYISSIVQNIDQQLGVLRPDQPFVKTDAIELEMLNEGKSGATMDIQPIINVLNAQNQAALKSMATILGRGESGVNTASVEARIFSMIAQELNGPLDQIWSDFLTLALRLQGSTSTVVCKHDSVELRPTNELEPSMVQRQARLQNDLSLGLITDDDYHLAMYGRIRPDSIPELSGTGFYKATAASTDSAGTQPTSSQRQSTKKADKGANSNQVK
jgi:hypothetical protein